MQFSPFEASQIVFYKFSFITEFLSSTGTHHPSAIRVLCNLLIACLQNSMLYLDGLQNNFVACLLNTLEFILFFVFNSQYTCFLLFAPVVLFFFSRFNNIDSFTYSTYYLILMHIYGLLADLIISYLGTGRMFLLPFFYYLFIFLIFFNLYGMFPNAFALTSHLSITLSISCIIWFSTLLNALRYRGGTFFSDFIMAGIPKPLVPVLMIVEILSFIIRLFSPALRLFANVVAGHILIHVFITVLNTLVLNFVFSISIVSLVSSFVVVVPIFVLLCFEVCIQYYKHIFCWLLRSYIHVIFLH